MRADDIVRVDREARALFTYQPDGVFDRWRSFGDDVLLGRAWAGDCDDLTSTVLDLLGRAGQPLDRRWRLTVGALQTGRVDHLVGCALSDEGAWIVVGDTFGPAYGAWQMRHQPFDFHRLDERNLEGKPVWRLGVPWKRPPKT